LAKYKVGRVGKVIRRRRSALFRGASLKRRGVTRFTLNRRVRRVVIRRRTIRGVATRTAVRRAARSGVKVNTKSIGRLVLNAARGKARRLAYSRSST